MVNHQIVVEIFPSGSKWWTDWLINALLLLLVLQWCHASSCLFFSVYLCFLSTEYKGVDDDSRYRRANYKAKNHINREVGCKGDSNSKHSLKSDGQQQDETSTVPCTEREKAWTWVCSLSTCISETLWQWQGETKAIQANMERLWYVWKLPHLETLSVLWYRYAIVHKMWWETVLVKPYIWLCQQCPPLGPCFDAEDLVVCVCIVKGYSAPG